MERSVLSKKVALEFFFSFFFFLGQSDSNVNNQLEENVLVSCSCVTSFSDLIQHNVIIRKFLWIWGWVSWVLCSGFHQAEVKIFLMAVL